MFKKIVLLLFFAVALYSENSDYIPVKYRVDDASEIAIDKKIASSHIKIYLPSIPYSYIMRLVNGTLVRLNDSPKGWEYFLAYKHEKVDALTYDFWLREDVRFQDGTVLNADSVVENLTQFQKGAFTYTDIHHKLKSVEKIDDYKIRIHLNKPYGMLLNDLARVGIYTSSYLKKYTWAHNIVAENTKVAGPYGSGPYMLFSGHAVGLNQSEKIVLKANPYYFKKNEPHIETITIYTKLPIDDVVNMIGDEEGKLDIAVIAFDKKTEIVNSKFAKLISVKSTFNINIHMNLMNPNSKLQNQKIRQALNQAIDQKRLIKFAYKNEGVESPFPISANSYYAKKVSNKYVRTPKLFFNEKELHKLLKGLKLKVVIQDRFLSLFKGIEYQLNKYGVELNYETTTDESYILNKLLKNRKNKYDWDLLVWGNDDWYGHPWGAFFAFYTSNEWCSIQKDVLLDEKLRTLFEIENTDAKFQNSVDDILNHVYNKAYMLSVPSPKLLIALNKEVSFTPSSVAILKLWEAKLTPYHWSIRENLRLPEYRKDYILPIRIKNNE